MGKVIIIGATSGIGKGLVEIFSNQGYEVGVIGRRKKQLEEIAENLSGKSYIRQIDITLINDAIEQFKNLIKDMETVDVIVISAGVGYINPNLDWIEEEKTISTNVCGFAAMCNVAANFFIEQGHGHLVGISSIASIRGNGSAPAYSASKAFISNYLEGLRFWIYKKGVSVTITEIQPGFVDTAMAQGNGLFWVAPVNKAAKQIYGAIMKKQPHAYITRRWRFIAWILKIVPGYIMKKF